jgi:esterase
MGDSLHLTLRHCQAADGLPLGYRVHRCGVTDAPALVMIHGLASNSTRFSELCARTRLRDAWDLLCPDLRGHGASMTRDPIGRQRWCTDLLTLLDAEGHARAVFMGHSLGAQVAMDLAVSEPQRVRGLILVDPVFPPALRGMLGLVRRVSLLNRALIAVLRVSGLARIGRRHFPYRDLHALDCRTRALLERGDFHGIARIYMSPRADLRYLPLINYLQDLREVVRPVPDPADIPMPVLVLRSAGATVTEARIADDRIARFPRGRVVEIPADHWLLTERPEEARRVIEEWCGALQDAGG